MSTENVKTEDSVAVRRQHVVSQVVLRRFADSRGTVCEYDVQTRAARRSPPREVGFVEHFIRRDPLGSERRWQQVEEKLPRVFEALDDRALVGNKRLEDVVRKAIALHWARSKLVQAVWDCTYGRVIARFVDEHPDVLFEAFYRRFGLYPAGAEGLRMVAEELTEPARRALEERDVFRDRVFSHFGSMRRFIANLSLEVAEPEEGEFLLGDAPVILLRTGHLGVGPLQGVSLDKANAIVLPFGPRHLISMAREPQALIKLDGSMVRKMNSAQVSQAFSHVFFRAGSALGSQVGEILDEQAVMAQKANRN